MYNKHAHIHFIGIGGIGMSGIATILRYQGYRISGCDLDLEQTSIKKLKEIGCTIHQGNNTIACHDNSINILVYSSAIPATNPEILRAQQREIPTIPRALMLAELMRTKYSVAIAGSHGKTTTTSLIAHILIEAGLDPTVIIGGHLKAISHNARLGNGDFLVAEADESDRSLLHLYATLAIVTNIDYEHVETYTDIDDITHTFRQFLTNIPFYGSAILCSDDPYIQSILPIVTVKTILYGFNTEANWYATNLELYPSHSTFILHRKGINDSVGFINLSMPGKHNVLNALAAIALTNELNIPLNKVINALQTFSGVDRRFTYRGTYRGAELFDDYGHHPNEIKHTLEVARRRAHNKVIVIFQLHRYTRSKALWNLFIETFLKCPIDYLLITDIYAASEPPLAGINAHNFINDLCRHNPPFEVRYIPSKPDYYEIKSQIDPISTPDDLILFLGAGTINRAIPFLLSNQQ